jgi:putative ABC transport system permease protein
MFKNYLLTAWKVFMRRKLFTAINLACIVLTLVVLMVITSLLETAFFPGGVEGKSDRFLQVIAVRMDAANGHGRMNTPLGYKLIDKYLKPMQGVERVAAVTFPEGVSVYQGDRVTELQMRRADADYWKVLDFKLLAGRLPDAGDDASGRQVAVVNQSSARKLFPGPAANAVGRKIDVGGHAFEIVGVVEDAMHLNAYADIWAPISTFTSTDYRNQLTGPFFALILAKRAADLPRIRRDVERIASGVVADDPKTWNKVRFWADSKLDLFARLTVGSDTTADSGAGKLLAIVAFGATSFQLAAQLVVENVLLCLAGGLLALAATAGVLHWLENADLIPYLKVEMDLAVFGYGLLIATVFGLVSGAVPAWKMSRLDPVHALKGVA